MRKKLLYIGIGTLLIMVTIGSLVWMFRSLNQRTDTVSEIEDPFGTLPGDRDISPQENPQPDGSLGTSTHTNAPQLRQITSIPTKAAGTTIVGSSTLVRFIDQATGHIYETELEEVRAARKISNTTIPRIQEARWNSLLTTVLVRYLDSSRQYVQSYSATLVPDTTASDTPQMILDGAFLPEDSSQVVFSPDGTRLFYLVPNAQGSLGYLSNADGTGQTQIFTSPFRELLVEWNTPEKIVLVTKPSESIPGFSFILTVSSRSVETFLMGIPGLTVSLNPQGSYALFSSSDQGFHTTQSLALSGNLISDVSLITLPEKCTWSKKEEGVVFCAVPTQIPDQNFPDDWYKGLIHYVDILWKLDLKTGATDMIMSPGLVVPTNFEMADLSLSPDESFLLFKNRYDGSLWSVRLTRDPRLLEAPSSSL